jgi:hypothetical protein
MMPLYDTAAPIIRYDRSGFVFVRLCQFDPRYCDFNWKNRFPVGSVMLQ